jgi:hypothetical protein
MQKSLSLFLVVVVVGACSGEPTSGAGWTVTVSKENTGEGYRPAWAERAVGVNWFGWIVDARWSAPADVERTCPDGTTIVQVVHSFKHTWRPNTPPPLMTQFRDRRQEVDNPIGEVLIAPGVTEKDPTYRGSMPAGTGHNSADTPGSVPMTWLMKLEGELETCAVCRGSWRVLGCLRWGFATDFTKTPPETESTGLTPSATASTLFQTVLAGYVN